MSIEFTDYLTVAQAAETAGLTPRRITALISAGRLAAERLAGVWFIPRTEWERFAKTERRPGNPQFTDGKRKKRKS